jgi:hypothetical protein
VTVKGQFIKKFEWDIIYWPRKNNLQILFFSNLKKKLALCVYGEYAKGGKSVKILHISVNNRKTREKF